MIPLGNRRRRPPALMRWECRGFVGKQWVPADHYQVAHGHERRSAYWVREPTRETLAHMQANLYTVGLDLVSARLEWYDECHGLSSWQCRGYTRVPMVYDDVVVWEEEVEGATPRGWICSHFASLPSSFFCPQKNHTP